MLIGNVIKPAALVFSPACFYLDALAKSLRNRLYSGSAGFLQQTMSVSKAASGLVGKVTGAVRGSKVTLKELLSSPGGWKIINDGKLA